MDIYIIEEALRAFTLVSNVIAAVAGVIIIAAICWLLVYRWLARQRKIKGLLHRAICDARRNGLTFEEYIKLPRDQRRVSEESYRKFRNAGGKGKNK